MCAGRRKKETNDDDDRTNGSKKLLIYLSSSIGSSKKRTRKTEQEEKSKAKETSSSIPTEPLRYGVFGSSIFIRGPKAAYEGEKKASVKKEDRKEHRQPTLICSLS
jgi:hypothetical protein